MFNLLAKLWRKGIPKKAKQRKTEATGHNGNHIQKISSIGRTNPGATDRLLPLFTSVVNSLIKEMVRRVGFPPAISFLHLPLARAEPLVLFTDGSTAKGCLTGSFGIYAGLGSPLTCSVSLSSIGDTIDSQYAEKIAIIYALKKVLALEMDTRPVVIFTDDVSLVIGVNALQLKYSRFNLFEKEPDIASEILDIGKRLTKNIKNTDLTRSLKMKINSLMEKCIAKEDMYKRSQRQDLVHLFLGLHRTLENIRNDFKLSDPQQRLTLIESISKWLCSHYACQESNRTLSTRKYSKRYIDTIYLLAKSCSNGCVLVHVPGHSDILQNEFADFLAKLAWPKDPAQPFEALINESWDANRSVRKSEEQRNRLQDSKPMATVIPYEPLCCGSIEDPGSFPVCEEIWNNSNGQLDQFFTKTMKSGGLNSTWVDSYLQDNWIDHNNCLQSRMRHPSTDLFSPNRLLFQL